MNAPAIRDISVLVIDDQRAMRTIIRQLLRQIGITRTKDAENGRHALEKLSADSGIDPPDLVICDLHMAKMDGMAFTAAVRRRKTPLHPEMPIILLTGEQDEFLLDVAGQAGATIVLRKPCTSADLYQAITEAVGCDLASV
jgi:two-component system chemotaxis response regulator CheY